MSSAPSQAQDQRQDQPEVPYPGRAGSGRRWRWVAFVVVITAAAMVNSLGMSLGIAGIGAIFFALAGGRGDHLPVYLRAAEWTALATAGLLACSFVVAFGLPRRAKEQGAQGELRQFIGYTCRSVDNQNSTR